MDLGWLTDPWSLGFMRNAFLEVALIGIAAGMLGPWIVLYRSSYGAESLSHAMFPGLVVAALVGAPLLPGAALGVLVAALGVALLGRNARVGTDSAIAVVVSALFGAGAVLALSPGAPPRLQELLFGDLLGVSPLDLALSAGLVLVLLAVLRLLYRDLLLTGFDRTSARSLGGLPVRADIGLLCLLGLAIVVAVQGLGNLLVVAALIGPASAGRLLAPRLPAITAIAIGLALLAGLAGLYASYYLGTAAGASVTLAYVAAFFAALALSRSSRSAGRAGRRSEPAAPATPHPPGRRPPSRAAAS